MSDTKSKPQAGKARSVNPFESASSAIGFFADGVKQQANAKDFGNDFIQQLLKSTSYAEKSAHDQPKHGDMEAGKPLELGKKKNNPEQKPAHIRAAYDYAAEITRSSENLSRRESQEIMYRIKEITEELARLVNSSSILKVEFEEVVMSQPPVSPGKYHINFFSWVLTVIRQARMKVEDSGAWLQTMKSKKGQKQYWNMSKKHGTTFSLSNERTVATQTG